MNTHAVTSSVSCNKFSAYLLEACSTVNSSLDGGRGLVGANNLKLGVSLISWRKKFDSMCRIKKTCHARPQQQGKIDYKAVTKVK
jgi:hypothetical protein